MPDCTRQDARRIVECSGCAGFCGDQELYLADMEVSRAGGVAIVMFRSWRCLIRHGMKQHALSNESRPPVRCSECGRPGDEGRDCLRELFAGGHCTGTFRPAWEDLTS